MTPKPLPPLAEALYKLEGELSSDRATEISYTESALREFFAPYDAELARLRAENLELRRVGAVLYECALRKEPRDMEAAIEACLAWERLQEAAP